MMNSRATVVPSEERDNLLQAEIIKFFQDGEDGENKNSLSFELPPGLQTEFLQLLKNLPTTNTQDSNIKRIVALAKSIKAVFLNYQAEMQGILFRITDYNFLNYAITLYFNVYEIYGMEVAQKDILKKEELTKQLVTALQTEGFDLHSISLPSTINNKMNLLVSKVFSIETYHFMLQQVAQKLVEAGESVFSRKKNKEKEKEQDYYQLFYRSIRMCSKQILKKLKSLDTKEADALIKALKDRINSPRGKKLPGFLKTLGVDLDESVAQVQVKSYVRKPKNNYEDFKKHFDELITKLPSEDQSSVVKKLKEIFDKQSDKTVAAGELRTMVADSAWTEEKVISFLSVLINSSAITNLAKIRQEELGGVCEAFKKCDRVAIKLQIAKLFLPISIEDRKLILAKLQALKKELEGKSHPKWNDFQPLLAKEELSGEDSKKLDDLIQQINLNPTQPLNFVNLTTLIDIFFHCREKLNILKGLSPIHKRFQHASKEELQAAILYVESRFKGNSNEKSQIVELISDALAAHKERSQKKEKAEIEKAKREMEIHVQTAKFTLNGLFDMPRVSKKDIERVKQQVAEDKKLIEDCRKKLQLESSKCGLKEIEALEFQLTQIEIRLTREENSIKALGEPFFSKKDSKRKIITLYDAQNKISVVRQIVDQLPKKLASQVNFDSSGFESKIDPQEGKKHVLQKGQYAINTLIQNDREIAQFIEHRTKSNRYQSMAVLSKKIDDAAKTEKIGPHQDISSIYLKLADAQSLTFMRDNGKDEKVYIRAGNPPELVKAYMLVCAARGLDYVNESTCLQVPNKENIEFVKNQLIAFGEAEPRASLRSR